MHRRSVTFLLAFMAMCWTSVEAYAQSSNSEANRLFVEANTIFISSKNLSESDREQSLTKVRSLLDRVTSEYPDSKPARAIKEGNAGTIVLSDLPASNEVPQSPSIDASLAAASSKLDELAEASALTKLEHSIVLSDLPASNEVPQSPPIDASLAAASSKLDELAEASALTKLEHSIEILDILLFAKDLEEARVLAGQILALPKWEKVLAPQTVKEVRETASNADVVSKTALVCLVGTYILDAVIEQYVEPFVRTKLGGGFDSYLVSFLHETVDGACAAGPALLAGSAGTGGLLYPIAKGVEVLNELDSLNKANADLVDQSVDFAKLQISALESVSTYDFQDLLDYKIAQDAVATDLMTGSGLNVGAGRRLLIVNAVMLIKARQIEGKDVNAELESLGQQISEFDGTPENLWYRWAKTVNLGRDGLRDYAGFAARVFDDLGVVREPSAILVSDVNSLEPTNYSAPDGYMWAQLASRRTIDEARAFASGAGARIFRTQNGWHAITGALIFESESLPDMISDRGWPNDSLLTRGESFVEELSADLTDATPQPAFIHTKTLRATDVIWFSWDNGTRTVYDTRALKQGEDVVVWGGPDEEGYCRGGGGEGAVIKCADLVAFATRVDNGGVDEAPSRSVEFVFPKPRLDRVVRLSDDGELRSTGFNVDISDKLSVNCTHWVTQGAGAASEYGITTWEALVPKLQCNLWSDNGDGSSGLVSGVKVLASYSQNTGALTMTLSDPDILNSERAEQNRICNYSVQNQVFEHKDSWEAECPSIDSKDRKGTATASSELQSKDVVGSVQIAGQSCTLPTSPVSRDTLLAWVSKPINGTTASGANWSLNLWNLTTKEVGPAVFTNSKGEKTTGLWRPAEGQICQSYNKGESWACHSVFSCGGGDENAYVMQNNDGQFTSIVETARHSEAFQVASSEKVVPPSTKAQDGTTLPDADYELYKTNTVSVLGTRCKVSFPWEKPDAVSWDGTCQNAKISGEGTLKWRENGRIIWISRVGEQWGLVLENGSLRIRYPVSSFKLSVARCGDADFKRDISVITNNDVDPRLFSNTYLTAFIMRAAIRNLAERCRYRGKLTYSGISASIFVGQPRDERYDWTVEWRADRYNGANPAGGTNIAAKWKQNNALRAVSKEVEAANRAEAAERRAEEQRKAQLRAEQEAEIRRQAEARRQQAAREAAGKKAAEIAAFQKQIEQRWARHMDDMFSGKFVIENVGDLLQFNKAKAISMLSQGVTLQLATQNMSFQDGVVIITHEHDPTDVLKPVRDMQLANMREMDRFLHHTQTVGRDYSGPSVNVVCRLSASVLERLDGKITARFDAKLQSLNGRSAVFDCKLKR